MFIKVKYFSQVHIVDKKQESKYCLATIIIMVKGIFYPNHLPIRMALCLNGPELLTPQGGHSASALAK